MSRTPHRALAALSVAALALTGCSVSGSSGDGASSSAPGAGGEPIHEWLELRPILSAPTTVAE